MQGRSLIPLLRGQSADWPEEIFVQISESQVGRAVRTDRWKYGVIAPGKDGWSESASDRYEEACLYDLEADPYELNNRVGKPAFRAIADDLKERLLRRMRDAGEKVPDIVNRVL
jgi:arylsulfatase A-like enzyme